MELLANCTRTGISLYVNGVELVEMNDDWSIWLPPMFSNPVSIPAPAIIEVFIGGAQVGDTPGHCHGAYFTEDLPGGTPVTPHILDSCALGFPGDMPSYYSFISRAGHAYHAQYQ
jgi:hypothetical protein